jgi:hypothetical protein
MNVPLDNLYHWVRGCANESVSIYIFKPHGSKNIHDLDLLSPNDNVKIAPEIVCHDQEPLNYNTVRDISLYDVHTKIKSDHPEWNSTALALDSQYRNLNYYTVLRVLKPRSIFDRYILLHSEKNSVDVEQFSATAEPVYYWSHAVISLDWFRFAQYDVRLSVAADKKKTFLVYCRAWSGSREYRLKFLDLLVNNNLIDSCRTSILHNDQDYDLESYQCANSQFQPSDINQLLAIEQNYCPASASADYDPVDITETDISVILETVVDKKIHLTEKTLRPIACGHPFMLMAGPGALDYLRSYGFKTFSPWIDESYDCESDTVSRMKLIVKEMQRIENLDASAKKQMFEALSTIAQHNRQHFFSQQFSSTVEKELSANLNAAIDRIKHTRGQRLLELTRTTKLCQPKLPATAEKLEVLKVLRKLRKDPTVSIRDEINRFPPGFFNP